LVYFTIRIFCGHLVYFRVIWYIFPRFEMLYQEKSGNPDCRPPLALSVLSVRSLTGFFHFSSLFHEIVSKSCFSTNYF
jgi:hypothetical protein